MIDSIDEKIRALIPQNDLVNILTRIRDENGYKLTSRPGIVKGREVTYVTLMYRHRVICDVLSDGQNNEIIFHEDYLKELRKDPNNLRLLPLEEFLRSKQGREYLTNLT